MKKLKSPFYIAIISVSLIFTIYLWYKYKYPNYSCEKKIHDNEYGNINAILNSKKLRVEDNLFVVNYRNTAVKFDSILNDGVTLCYNYSLENCQSCILNTLWLINYCLPNLEFVVLISDAMKNPRTNYFFRDFKPNVFRVKNGNPVVKRVDSLGVPYLFVIDNGLTVRSIHLTSDINFLNDSTYLKSISHFFTETTHSDFIDSKNPSTY